VTEINRQNLPNNNKCSTVYISCLFSMVYVHLRVLTTDKFYNMNYSTDK